MLTRHSSVFLLCLSLFLSACGKEEPEDGLGKFGMMEDSTPEFAAMQFFDHIYHDKNIRGALALSSPKMNRLLRSYRTNRNVQRHVLNLAYDTVTLELDGGDTKMRAQYADRSAVTVFLSGRLHGDKIEDLRTVELVRINRQWKVDSVKERVF